jgi:hypothetical protein
VPARARFKGQCGLVLAMALMVFGAASPATAQSLTPGPPGPFVVDVRGVTSGIPGTETLFSSLPSGSAVPTRGFGGTVGGHLYALQMGPARLGFGIDVSFARGSSADASATLATVDPQVSFNFGTSDGWSYLSAGVGVTRVSADPVAVSDSVRAFNWGGGARWFLRPRLGFGFDVRVRHLAESDVLPGATAVSAALGFSLRPAARQP